MSHAPKEPAGENVCAVNDLVIVIPIFLYLDPIPWTSNAILLYIYIHLHPNNVS